MRRVVGCSFHHPAVQQRLGEIREPPSHTDPVRLKRLTLTALVGRDPDGPPHGPPAREGRAPPGPSTQEGPAPGRTGDGALVQAGTRKVRSGA